MITRQDRAVETFLKAWAPEMGRSIEMFRGEQPGTTWAVLNDPGFAAQAGILWWHQRFESGAAYSIWIGAPEQTWRELTAGLGETPEERRGLFSEMLGNALEGAAHALSGGKAPRIVCKEGAFEEGQPAAALTWGGLTVTLNGGTLAPILAGLEPAFAARIAPPGDSTSAEATMETNHENRMLLERLIELELPISIVLGRAVLPIRDVLKLSAGSLVDLDRRVGDPVEVVVHNVVVARGEVVAVKGNYGVRVKEVISRKDRIALQTSAGTERALAQ